MAGQQLCDCMGLPLTCASEEALELHNKALLAYVSLRESLVPYASKALELDPTLILEHCMLVRMNSSCVHNQPCPSSFH